ncbi:MAG: MMPL family transporter [Polyangiaceae bacterium]|nr:MMPL family transporter [Polyangiaceae bacterium]
MLEALAGLTYTHRKAILVMAIVWFGVAVSILVSGVGRLSAGSIRGLEADYAGQRVNDVVGYDPDTTFVAIFESPSLAPRSPSFRRAMEAALAPLEHDPRVALVTTPFNAPAIRAQSMTNTPARSAYAYVSLRGDFSEAAHAYAGVRAQIHSDTLAASCTGRLPFTHDLDRVLEHDLLRAEAISLPICVLLLGLVFGSAVAALLPVCVGALAVVSGLAAVFVVSRFVELAQFTTNICSLIGLGVAIDYSLFIVSRYREELRAGHDLRGALRLAMIRAGRVVLFSGLAVTIGLSGLLVFTHSYLMAMGLGGAIVVCFAVIFALTFLPALLAVIGAGIHAGRLPFGEMKADGAGWRRLAHWVMRRPIAILVPALAILLSMGVPFLRLRMAASDVRVLPATTEARRGYDLFRDRFPDAAATHVLVAVVFPSSPALDPARIDALYDFVTAASDLPHVSKVESIVDPSQRVPRNEWPALLLSPPPELARMIEEGKHLSVGPNTVLVDVTTDRPSESDDARAIVRGIRDRRRVGDGTAYVGGQTAIDVDTTQYILAGSPHALGFVVVVTYLILFIMLGSVLLPVKAVAMNLLSITGSFGALVWIFQDGHVIVKDGHPIEPTLPVLLFCALFGLSMDYEVLLLTRMKEAFEESGDNQQAVAEGLAKSAGLITSAAAIMVVVFSAFAFAQIVPIQAVGFGMALAVLLDATLVRVVVVPATMRLLGHWNWWAPASLERIARAARPHAPHE